MKCEVCGEKEALVEARIDVAVMKVCKECSELGKVLNPEKIFEKSKKTDFLEKWSSIDIAENYPKIIKEAREKKNLEIPELASKIGEKENILMRVERGKLVPDLNLVKKLERLLNINLRQEVIKGKALTTEKRKTTIGDIAKIKS